MNDLLSSTFKDSNIYDFLDCPCDTDDTKNSKLTNMKNMLKTGPYRYKIDNKKEENQARSQCVPSGAPTRFFF